jgi:malonate-semialdehyde dehydrogenase (acetylating) / methylmalonate-semialdehyde dehydrogenase
VGAVFLRGFAQNVPMPESYFVERVPNYVGGRWIPSANPEHAPIANPATGEPLGFVPMGAASDVGGAVQAARAAFPAWRDLPAQTRARFLFDLRDRMEQHFAELVSICTQEHGKTLEESRGDVRRAIDNVESACGMPAAMLAAGGALEQIAGGIDCHAVRQPMGVFAIIAPYNFPSMVPFWFLPYAIASGNTVVVKPSEQVPFSQHRLFQLLHETGLPPGVCNMVNGARDVVNGILEHPDIAGVSFVGSSPVAAHVYERCGATGKRVQALGGAKNFGAVMDDCAWDKTVANVVDSSMGCAGQRCLALSVVIGVGDAYGELERRLPEALARMKVGYGMEKDVTMGPLISARHRERVLAAIDRGEREGGKLVVDGRALKVGAHPRGHWLGPTLFTGVTPEMTLARDEIFGPVLALMRAADLDEALRLVNAHPLANASSIYTSSGAHARRWCRDVDASMVGVNVGVAAPMAFFGFGGAKGSFFGDLKAHGREQVQFYTQNKTSIVRWW